MKKPHQGQDNAPTKGAIAFFFSITLYYTPYVQ